MDQDEKLIKLLSLLATDMQTIQNSMLALQKDLRSLHSYTESTDAEVRKIRDDINSQAGEMRELTGRVMILENQINDNTEAIRKYQMSESSLTNDIHEIYTAVEQTNEAVSAEAKSIRMDVAKSKDEVTTVQQSIKDLASNDEVLSNSLNILRQELEATRAELQSTNTDTFSIKEQLDKIVSNTNEVRSSAAEELIAIRTVDEKVSSYTANFYEITEEIKKNRDVSAPVDQHVQELSISIANIIEDLEVIDDRIDKHTGRTEVSIELIQQIKAASDSLHSALRSV